MGNNESQPANLAQTDGDRRTFMKGIVAGTVAAGTLAATTNAAPGQSLGAAAAAPLVFAKPRPETAKLRLSFDQQKQPTLIDIQNAIANIVRRSGCTNCGLGGIDIHIRLDQLINPADRYMASVEGEMQFG